jgi:multidrug resistance protein, MATE family
MSSPTPNLGRLSSAASDTPSVGPRLIPTITENAVESDDDDQFLGIAQATSHSFTSGFRRPSYVGGSHPLHLAVSQPEEINVEPSAEERARLIKQEKSLLKDNHLIPKGKSSRTQSTDVDVEQGQVSETTGLLSGGPSASYDAVPESSTPTADDIDRQFQEAVSAGLIKTTWQREAKVLARTSAPLILTFMLQYSLHMTSIFVVGHIGTDELGAVSVGSMTASITGWSVFQGCVTALDTLCSQAYGAGNKTLVGLHMQRMVWFLFCILVPIGILWINSGYLLKFIVPEPRTAELAGLYLRIILFGAPGYALYECGKRYLMCQGIFDPILYVLLVCAPTNIFLNWLLVWVCISSLQNL